MKLRSWNYGNPCVGLLAAGLLMWSAVAWSADDKTLPAQLWMTRAEPIPVFITLPGKVIPADEVQVASRLMGYVHNLDVHEGQTVRQGQRLLQIDPVDVEGGIAKARSGLTQAQAALKDAKRDFDRFSALYKEEAVPEVQYQKYKLAYDIARARLRTAQAGLKSARGQLRYADVRSPIDGMVAAKMIDNGQLASPGHPLLLIQGSRHLQVEVQADARAYSHLGLGVAVPIDVDGPGFGKQRVEGTVVRRVDVADPVSHSHLVKLSLPEAAKVASGAFARVFVAVGQRDALRVPVQALYKRAGIEGVFVVDSNDLAHFRMVRAGQREAGQVVILSGLVAGEQVIVQAHGKLRNGSRVTPMTDGDSHGITQNHTEGKTGY